MYYFSVYCYVHFCLHIWLLATIRSIHLGKLRNRKCALAGQSAAQTGCGLDRNSKTFCMESTVSMESTTSPNCVRHESMLPCIRKMKLVEKCILCCWQQQHQMWQHGLCKASHRPAVSLHSHALIHKFMWECYHCAILANCLPKCICDQIPMFIEKFIVFTDRTFAKTIILPIK